jgi:hypothetical protein
MFIQVIQGRVTDAAGLRAALDRWVDELGGTATGWLGFTGGVTDNGTGIAVVRFESEEAARRNSDRPEQGAWWAETEQLYQGEVSFHDCVEVDQFMGGGADEAGFVQIIQGRVNDTDRWRELAQRSASLMPEFRPDIIGGTVALHGDGGFTQVVYFTSEQAARDGERKDPPPELQTLLDEEAGLYDGELSYFDLRDPWLASPR